MISKQERYEFRKARSRNRLFENGINRMRLSVYRSTKYLYEQVVDDKVQLNMTKDAAKAAWREKP